MSETPLRVRDDGSFTLVQLTDTHWHNGEPEDLATRALIETVLDAEQPDFVVITGDLIGGDECLDAATALTELTRPIVSRELPWAAVWGNHDEEANLSRLELMNVLTSLPGCLASRGPENVSGVGNYHLTVHDRSDEPAWNLLFLDSNAYAEDGLNGYGWIRHDQIAWFLETLRQLRQTQGQHPALCFFHIPLPEVHELWGTGRCLGTKHEHICAPELNTGFFSAMHQSGDVIGAFYGHDHVNDYIGELYGIRLGYGRASGYGTYGKEGFERGARVIRFRAGERSFTSWIRLADGTRLEQEPQS